MSIENYYGLYVATCDICNEEKLGGEHDFYGAVSATMESELRDIEEAFNDGYKETDKNGTRYVLQIEPYNENDLYKRSVFS